MNQGWIGFDFDATLSHCVDEVEDEKNGRPVDEMVKKLKAHLAKGDEVKILSARAVRPEDRKKVSAFLKELGVPDLPITDKKDQYMTAFYDDRAQQVLPNLGLTVMEIVDELLRGEITMEEFRSVMKDARRI